MIYGNFEELINAVSRSAMLNCVLFGNRSDISKIFEKLGHNINEKISIVEAADDKEAATQA